MAETPVAANNKPVKFDAKAQREPAGVPNLAPMKSAKGKLSPRARKSAKSAMKRGMISEKAAKKHLGEG